MSLVIRFSLGRAEIVGNSMNPTFNDRNRVVYSVKPIYRRFDIVAFYPPNQVNEEYVKRIIGLPGDIVEYKEGRLLINYQVIKEPYLDSTVTSNSNTDLDFTFKEILNKTKDLKNSKQSQKIPEDMYLVLGDNRANSVDSREFGLIHRSAIQGVIRIRYWPIWKLTFFNY